MISVLMVEDDAFLGKTLQEQLLKAGYQCVVCQSVQEVLATKE